jgi:ubiquitin carboxyl-terminal hydrolase 8
MAARTNGFSPSSSTGPRSGRKEPFPHIDDLTSVAVDLDLHSPLKTVLEIGEGHMRQAITYSDFSRPDLGLQEYIKAFTIAVDKIPKHKDYPSLKTNRGDLGRQYNVLKLHITNNGDRFDKIKEEIKEDNRRSGTQPKKSASEMTLMNLPSVPSTLPHQQKINGINGANGTKPSRPHEPQNTKKGGQMGSNAETPARDRNGTAMPKSKPAVQPKPQALHGNAIKPTTNPVAQDLASRFARLRDPQDASSRPTTTAVVPKSGGLLESPFPAQPQLIIDSAVPTMPKLPAAIYSPARGTVTSEVADLPSSTPRGMFSRTNSIASITCSSTRTSIDVAPRQTSTEQYATAHTFGNGFSSAPTSPKMQIPGGATITAHQLQEYMQKGASVVRLLLIDVRSREEFDEGHILSQSTICIEPAVLARGNVSAADIEESLNIAPDEEMKAFENRGEFDLVVFYDQDSTSVPPRPSQYEQEIAIFTLYQALVHFNYGGELRHGPKLLEGGVEAWVDLCGPRSLQESRTSAAIQDGRTRLRRATGPNKARFGDRRRTRAQTKALKPEEIKQFEESLQKDEPRQEYLRSTEEFLRRYPSAAEIRESMASPGSPSSLASQHLNKNVFESDLPPSPPARPAPAVPRTSYSGLSSKEPTTDVVYAKAGRAVGTGRDKPSGLENTSNNCFANSAIQVILFSPGFAAEFTRQDWPANWAPAVKNPQLMSRILGNLLQWLAGRQFPALRPTTLLVR